MMQSRENKFNDAVLKILNGGLWECSFIQQLQSKDLTSAQISFLTEHTDAVLKNNPKQASALTLASYIHQYGIGRSTDYAQAIQLSERAIGLGNSNAMINRAYMHQHAQGGPLNFPAAIDLYEQAITLGNATAMNNRAFMHKEGQGGPVNFPAAILLYEQAITLGHMDAVYNRALMHKEGQGGPVNYPAAIDLFDRAIASGDAEAMTNRAHMHKEGQGGPVDIPAGIELYEKAIAAGNSQAMINRALMHKEGQGGPVDIPAGIELYEKAIAAGNSQAMTNRALMHQEGQGGPVNFPAAIELFENAIALGNVSALYYRAMMYKEGLGSPTDLLGAAKLIHLLKLKKLPSELIEAVHNLLTDLKHDLTSMEFTEAHYHLTFADKTDDNAWQKEPLKFLSFLARDKIITAPDRCSYVKKIISAFPTIVTKIDDQDRLDLLGEYYYQEANRIFREEWLHESDDNKRRDGLDKAFELLLKKISPCASQQGDACYDIGYHIYQYYSTLHHMPLLGFLKAQTHFQRGIALNHPGCREMFENILKLLGEQPNIQTPLSHMNLADLHTEIIHKQPGAQLVAIIKSFPLELDHLIYCSQQKPSRHIFNFSFWRHDDQQLIVFRDRLERLISQDEMLQNDAHLTFDSESIITLAQRYLAYVAEAKQVLPTNLGVKGNVIDELNEMITAIQEKASQTKIKLVC